MKAGTGFSAENIRPSDWRPAFLLYPHTPITQAKPQHSCVQPTSLFKMHPPLLPVAGTACLFFQGTLQGPELRLTPL